MFLRIEKFYKKRPVNSMESIYDGQYNSEDDSDYECDSTTTGSESESDGSDVEQGSAAPSPSTSAATSGRPVRQAAVKAREYIALEIQREMEKQKALKAATLKEGTVAKPKARKGQKNEEPAKKKRKTST